jgi:hypothetical protein
MGREESKEDDGDQVRVALFRAQRYGLRLVEPAGFKDSRGRGAVGFSSSPDEGFLECRGIDHSHSQRSQPII